MWPIGYLEDQALKRSERAVAGVLLDRSPAIVRPVRQSDVGLIQKMHLRLSRESVYYRYLTHRVPEPGVLQRLCFLDDPSGQAIVATVQEPQEKVIAMACYAVDPDDPTAAEPAILVEDSYQGHGLGKRMFSALCQQARQKDLERFECFTHPANHRVLRLIRSCGLRPRCTYGQGVREIRVWLKPE